MLVWANLHGGFTLGLLLAGAFALEALVTGRGLAERKKIFLDWLKFGVAALLVSCITPYGSGSILVTFQIFGLGDALGLIDEWRSPDFQTQPLAELILLIALYLVLARGVKLPVMRTLIVVGLVHMFLRHVRNAELLATLAPLAIAPVLARQWPAIRRDPEGKALFGSLAGRPGATRSRSACCWRWSTPPAWCASPASVRPRTRCPTAALEFAREAGLKGNVLNHYGYGGYLISAGIPTFIDGRGELFGGEFIKDYVDAVHLRGEDPRCCRRRSNATRSTGPCWRGAAGQQAAGPAARLASGLYRRQDGDLRPRAVMPYSLPRQGRGGIDDCAQPPQRRPISPEGGMSDGRCSYREQDPGAGRRARTAGRSRCRAPCRNRACGPRAPIRQPTTAQRSPTLGGSITLAVMRPVSAGRKSSGSWAAKAPGQSSVPHTNSGRMRPVGVGVVGDAARSRTANSPAAAPPCPARAGHRRPRGRGRRRCSSRTRCPAGCRLPRRGA